MPDPKATQSVRRWLGMRPWLLIVLVSCLIIGAGSWLFYLGHIVTGAYIPKELSKEALQPLTSNLPALNRIEIESVHAEFETVDKVLATKNLTENEIQEFENLWRNQNYIYDIQVACHEPGYRIRFYKDSSLLTEATICFHCQNIYFYKYPGAKSSKDEVEVVFGNISSKEPDPAYQKLRTYLSNLFPGHDPDAPKP